MQDLLKDHLVEHLQENERYFFLTCTVCGATWKSAPTAGRCPGCDIETELAEEVMKYNRMCPFCGHPVCLNCFEDIEGISLCVQCGQRLRQRLEVKQP